MVTQGLGLTTTPLTQGVDDTLRSVVPTWVLADPVSLTNTRWRRLSTQLHQPLRVLSAVVNAETAPLLDVAEWCVLTVVACVQ